ncbi:MAG: hypothetical protein M1118_13130 [Chloroflexi bacterium]|nr:hypothetical protein [Chloroflexota bacterium]
MRSRAASPALAWDDSAPPAMRGYSSQYQCQYPLFDCNDARSNHAKIDLRQHPILLLRTIAREIALLTPPVAAIAKANNLQVRSGAAPPQALATCRNLVLALLRRRHCPNIAAALRTCAWHPRRAVHLVL